jgi:signal peptidase I
MVGIMLVLVGGTAAAIVTLVGLRRSLLVVTVEGASMEPSLHTGDRLLVRRAKIARIRRGDVVVLARPQEDLRWTGSRTRRASPHQAMLIKRVAAVPGDLPPRDLAPALAHHPEPLVPKGHLVAFGDNFWSSLDSRQLGYFPADRLIGLVVRQMPGPVTVGGCPATPPRPGSSTRSR